MYMQHKIQYTLTFNSIIYVFNINILIHTSHLITLKSQ